MEDVKVANRFCGYTLLPAFLCFSTIGLYGILVFGEIPEYGKHPDPYSLGINWIWILAALFFIISTIAIPASILLHIHLVINKEKYSTGDFFSLAALVFSFGGFTTLQYLAPEMVAWILD